MKIFNKIYRITFNTGAEADALTGAAIGSIIPAIGTAVGGSVGGFLGALASTSSRFLYYFYIGLKENRTPFESRIC